MKRSKKMKKILIPFIGMALCLATACDGPKYPKVGDTQPLLKHFSVTLNSTKEEDSIKYLKNYGDEQLTTDVENNKHFIVCNFTIKHDESDEDSHKLDKNDFKLNTEYQKPLTSFGNIVEDYQWIGKEFSKNSNETIEVAFKVGSNIKLNNNFFVQVDFSNAFLNGIYFQI